MNKVSLAEQLTDISDSENAKKSRKSRARRVSSSESSENEECPTKRSKALARTKTSIAPVTYPDIPSTCGITRLPLKSIQNNGNYIFLSYKQIPSEHHILIIRLICFSLRLNCIILYVRN